MTETRPDQLGTRDKILFAAAEMYGENPATVLSVRSVAARAGVSTGSLRHFFPTQRSLRDELWSRLSEHFAPDDAIHDTARPARDRLVACLREVLDQAGTGERARATAMRITDVFIAPDPSPAIRTTYHEIEQRGQRRIESWLAVLAREGTLKTGDNAARARMLSTVLSGLTLERALPTTESLLESETATLYLAVDGILG